MGWLQDRSPWLVAIVVGYLVVGTVYALLNPLWEAPDELHHVSMVQYLRTHGVRLPSQEPGTVGLWQQEGNQPPLYYIIGALLVSPIDMSDTAAALRVNPHADIGIIRPDRNANRIVHRPDERFPSSQTAQASYLLRFFSLGLGAGTIIVTYQTGRVLFPEREYIALGAAGLNAFLPMYLYISASVNNDNLSNLLSNGLVLLLIRLLQSTVRPHLRTYLVIGILVGAGILSKLNIGLLIPIVALSLLAMSIRLRDWRPFVHGGVISGSLTIAIAGWWYWRNWRLFGDITGLERFLELVGRRATPANLPQLWTEREGFVRTFWGLFGSVNVPMADSIYKVLNIIGGLALAGAFAYIVFRIVRRDWDRAKTAAASLTLMWPAMTFVALLRWTSITPASQGRLMFGAVSGLMVWMAVGLTAWFPKRLQRYALASVVCLLAIVAVSQPFIAIAPAYALPEPADSAETMGVFQSDADQIAILDSRISDAEVHPGSYVQIEVDFEAISALTRDWSIFIHLTTAEGIIVGQRDVYPGRGLLATSDMAAGYAWQNPIAIYVPPTAFAPNTVDIRLGWYHLPTGERMQLDNGQDMLTLGQIALLPAESQLDVPNPQAINFGDRVELVGYDVTTLNPEQGTTLELTLYWRAIQSLEHDYVVFAQIIDPETLTKYADSNAMPVQWTRPTSSWAVGELIEDTHPLTIAPDASPGIYPIEVGLYLQEEGFPRLRVMGTYNDSVYLTSVRIVSRDNP